MKLKNGPGGIMKNKPIDAKNPDSIKQGVQDEILKKFKSQKPGGATIDPKSSNSIKRGMQA